MLCQTLTSMQSSPNSYFCVSDLILSQCSIRISVQIPLRVKRRRGPNGLISHAKKSIVSIRWPFKYYIILSKQHWLKIQCLWLHTLAQNNRRHPPFVFISSSCNFRFQSWCFWIRLCLFVCLLISVAIRLPNFLCI